MCAAPDKPNKPNFHIFRSACEHVSVITRVGRPTNADHRVLWTLWGLCNLFRELIWGLWCAGFTTPHTTASRILKWQSSHGKMQSHADTNTIQQTHHLTSVLQEEILCSPAQCDLSLQIALISISCLLLPLTLPPIIWAKFVQYPAADPSKLLILPRTHTCPPTDMKTCSYTHSLSNFYSATLKYGVRGSSVMPHRGNEKNKIHFVTAWLFHRMTLDSVMAVKGERESRDREREGEMHVI